MVVELVDVVALLAAEAWQVAVLLLVVLPCSGQCLSFLFVVLPGGSLGNIPCSLGSWDLDLCTPPNCYKRELRVTRCSCLEKYPQKTY